MRDLKQALLLLDLAREDLQVLGVMQDPRSVPERVFGFHAQQAVEKAAKAWLALLGVEYPLTHSLDELFDLIENRANASLARFRYLEILTPFAVVLRYALPRLPAEELDRSELTRRVSEFLDHVTALEADS